MGYRELAGKTLVAVILAAIIAIAVVLQVGYATIQEEPKTTLQWQSKYLGGDVESVSWSPDGKCLAAGTDSGRVFVFNFFGGFGVIIVESSVATSIWVEDLKSNEKHHYRVDGEKLALWASPGEYRVKVSNEYYVGPPVEVSVSEGVVVELSDMLGRLVIRAPSGSRVAVEWSSGGKNYTLRGEELVLWASPGEYRVRVVPLPLFSVWEGVVEVSPGSVAVASASTGLSLLGYSVIGLASSITAAATWAYYRLRVAANPVVERVEGIAVKGLWVELEVTVKNKGKRRYRGPLVVGVGEKTVGRVEVDIPGGERVTVKVKLPWPSQEGVEEEQGKTGSK